MPIGFIAEAAVAAAEFIGAGLAEFGIGAGLGEAAAGSAFGAIASDAALGYGAGLGAGFGAAEAGAAGAGLGLASGFASDAAIAGGAGAAGLEGAALPTLAAAGGAGELAGGFGGLEGLSAPALAGGGDVVGAAGVAPQATLGSLGGAAPAAAGPGASAITLPAGAAPIDATSAFAAGPGESVFSGATTATTGAAPGGGSAFGGIASDAAGGAGGGAAYGPTSTFATGDAAGFTAPATTAGSGLAAPTQSIGGQLWHGAGDVLRDIGGAINSPEGKAISTGIAGIGLARNLLAPQTIPGMSQQAGIAANAAQQGSLLSGYLTSGTLPPGVQAGVDQATAAAIQNIKASYASRGIAPGSSMEVQDINNVRAKGPVVGAQIAQQMLTAGTSLTGLSADVYRALVSENASINNGVNQAIGNLSNALAGGTKVTLQPVAA